MFWVLPGGRCDQSYLTEHPAAEELFAFFSVLKSDLCFRFAFYVLEESLQYMSGKKIAFKITFSVVIMESNTKFITQVTDYVSRNDYLSIQNLKQSHAQEKKKGKKKKQQLQKNWVLWHTTSNLFKLICRNSVVSLNCSHYRQAITNIHENANKQVWRKKLSERH